MYRLIEKPRALCAPYPMLRHELCQAIDVQNNEKGLAKLAPQGQVLRASNASGNLTQSLENAIDSASQAMLKQA